MLHWSQTRAGAVAVNTLKLKYIDRGVGEVFCSAADPRNALSWEHRIRIFFYMFTNMVVSCFRDKQL